MGRSMMKDGGGGNNSHSKTTARLFFITVMINCTSTEVTKIINLRLSCLEEYTDRFMKGMRKGHFISKIQFC